MQSTQSPFTTPSHPSFPHPTPSPLLSNHPQILQTTTTHRHTRGNQKHTHTLPLPLSLGFTSNLFFSLEKTPPLPPVFGSPFTSLSLSSPPFLHFSKISNFTATRVSGVEEGAIEATRRSLGAASFGASSSSELFGSSEMRTDTRQCGCDASVARTSNEVFREAEEVVVFDPVNKAPYKLSFAGAEAISRGEHSEVSPTVGLATYFQTTRASGPNNKRFFLCKQFQNNRCRAHQNCNSIHACRDTVTRLREQNPRSKKAIESDTLIPVTCVHNGAEEKFTVPMDKTEVTVGRRDVIAMVQPIGFLCAEYEHGRCRAGQECTKVHVGANHMKQLRQLWKTPCCSAHGSPDTPADTTSLPAGLLGFCVVSASAKGRDWDVSLLGFTRGLEQLCQSQEPLRVVNGIANVLPGKLCRPHAKKMCRWGVECNNIHVCRQRLPEITGELQGVRPGGAVAGGLSPTNAASLSCASASSASGTPKSTPEHTPRDASRAPSGISLHSVLTSPSTVSIASGGAGVSPQLLYQMQGSPVVVNGVPQTQPVAQMAAMQQRVVPQVVLPQQTVIMPMSQAQRQQQQLQLALMQQQQQQQQQQTLLRQQQQQQQIQLQQLHLQQQQQMQQNIMRQQVVPVQAAGVTQQQTVGAMPGAVPVVRLPSSVQTARTNSNLSSAASPPSPASAAAPMLSARSGVEEMGETAPRSPVLTILSQFQMLQLPRGGDNGFQQ